MSRLFMLDESPLLNFICSGRALGCYWTSCHGVWKPVLFLDLDCHIHTLQVVLLTDLLCYGRGTFTSRYGLFCNWTTWLKPHRGPPQINPRPYLLGRMPHFIASSQWGRRQCCRSCHQNYSLASLSRAPHILFWLANGGKPVYCRLKWKPF